MMLGRLFVAEGDPFLGVSAITGGLPEINRISRRPLGLMTMSTEW